MSTTITAENYVEQIPEDTAGLQAATQNIYLQVEAYNDRMESDRIEIDILRAETQVMLDAIHRMLGN